MADEWDFVLSELLDDETAEELEGVRMLPVASSNLAAVGYDRKQYILIIAFLDGSVYRYDGVPYEEYSGLLRADSHGEYFVDNIRLIYPYERIA